MAQWKVTAGQYAEPLHVEADGFSETGHEGRWVDFYKDTPEGRIVVRRFRSADIREIELRPLPDGRRPKL